MTLRRTCRVLSKRPQSPLDGVVDRMLESRLTLDEATALFQRRYVLRTGILTDGHCTHTAELLGVSRNTFTRLLHRLGLPAGLRKEKA